MWRFIDGVTKPQKRNATQRDTYFKEGILRYEKIEIIFSEVVPRQAVAEGYDQWHGMYLVSSARQ